MSFWALLFGEPVPTSGSNLTYRLWRARTLGYRKGGQSINILSTIRRLALPHQCWRRSPAPDNPCPTVQLEGSNYIRCAYLTHHTHTHLTHHTHLTPLIPHTLTHQWSESLCPKTVSCTDSPLPSSLPFSPPLPPSSPPLVSPLQWGHQAVLYCCVSVGT